ncbi:hypothetical protein GR11A_00170 [Vibrio phage vB_VcorM_GR11A]|nr:hypothetical protein GR11A_00170 [Vibrio phage vB_VcorM_GR11A]
MPNTKRVARSFLFEVLGLALVAMLVHAIQDHDHHRDWLLIGEVTILISVIAVGWNILFNRFYHRIFDSRSMSAGQRLLKTVTVESGLILICLPLIAYIFKVTIWVVALRESETLMTFVIYTFAFNFFGGNLKEWALEKYHNATHNRDNG